MNCSGKGVYQTYRKYTLTPHTRNFECTPYTDVMTEHNIESLGQKVLYDGLLKEWQDKEHSTNYRAEIKLAVGDVMGGFSEWLDSIDYDKDEGNFVPFQTHSYISYVPVTRIYYSVEKVRYSITILGTNHRIVYSDKPGKIKTKFAEIKQRWWKKFINVAK